MKRILRQLEAMDECLEHSGIEIIIESGLPIWILNKRSQASSGGYQRKSTESKSNHERRGTRGETSTLKAIKQPKPNDSKRITNSRKYPESDKIRRPCSFAKTIIGMTNVKSTKQQSNECSIWKQSRRT
uniref:Transposase n=1 Tax=Loa loa TaxID=7209 RepID=A0A1I7VG30_LOALO